MNTGIVKLVAYGAIVLSFGYLQIVGDLTAFEFCALLVGMLVAINLDKMGAN